MSEYGGFEMVGALPWSLPTENMQITTEPGDIMLYQGSNMVIFYGSNSWSYTPIGKIDGATASSVKDFLGSGNITLTVSLDTSSSVEQLPDDDPEGETYDMNGRRIDSSHLSPGIYVRNGRKVVMR